MRNLFVLCLVACILFGGRLTAQQEQNPSFRAGTDLVEVNVLVTDRDGNPVRGLTASDFTVEDNGRRQPISNFEFVDIPFVVGSGASSILLEDEAGVEVNPISFGRTYIFVLDDRHTTMCADDKPECLGNGPTFWTKEKASLFVERYFSDNDIGAVIFTSRDEAVQNLTNDRALLLKAISSFVGQRPNGTTETAVAARRGDDLALLGWLNTLSTTWSNGGDPNLRKTVLLFSEGIEDILPRAIDSRGGVRIGNDDPVARQRETAWNNSIIDRIQRTASAAVKANLAIVPIDARGVGARDNGHTSLRKLAADTGARPILRTNDFEQAFDRLVRSQSAYYLIGYAMPSGVKAGEERRISVKVNRRSTEVRHRESYVVPAVR